MQLAVAFSASSLFSTVFKVGLMAASAVGSYLLSGGKEASKAAKINDLRVSCSTYGKGIPIIFGTIRVSGNMIWSTDLEEEKSYINSKGKDVTGKFKDSKKGNEVYEYFGNFAMLMCEGPVDELIRVWADSNLIYDKYEGNRDEDDPNFEDVVGPGFSQEDGDDGGKTGKTTSKGKGHDGDSGRFEFRFYEGSDVQLQDPFMVEQQSADVVPAYRSSCYIMFEHFALMDFGNRIPTITAEVSVLKERAYTYKYCRPLIESDVTDPNNNVLQAFVDPTRYRLYCFMTHPDGRLARSYDLTTCKEIARVIVEGTLTVPEYNGLGHYVGEATLSLGSVDFIGLSGDGYPVGIPGGGNSAPVVFFNPDTMVPSFVFGGFTADLGNTDTSVQHAVHAAPLAYTVIDEISGEVTTSMITAVVSQFGDVSFFSGLGTDGAFGNYSWMSTAITGSNDFTINPGLPGASTSTFYVRGNGIIWKGTWGLTAAGQDELLGLYQLPDTTEIIYEFESTLDDLTYDMSDIFVVIGAECVGFLESVNSNDPLRQGTFAVKCDPDTGEVLWRIQLSPSAAIFDSQDMHANPVLTGNKMMWIDISGSDGGTIWEADFASETVTSYAPVPGAPAIFEFQNYWPLNGLIIHGGFVDDETLPDFDGEWTVWLAQVDRFAQVPVSCADIFLDLGRRAGIPDEKLNVADLDEQEITGFIIEEPRAARDAVEDLTKVFMFDIVESDYQLKAISRGNTTIVTIPQISLGVIDSENSDGVSSNDYYKSTTIQAIDCPQTVDVTSIDPLEKYQTNTQHYKRPLAPLPVMHSRDKLELNLPMAMEPDFAKQLAQKVCLSIWSERTNYSFMLPWTYMKYDPADVITFLMEDGLTFDARMLKMDLGADFSIDTEGVVQTAATYVSTIQASPHGGVVRIPTFPAPTTTPIVLDTPLLADADADLTVGGFTYYWGAAAYSPGLKFASIEKKIPPTDWISADVTAYEAIYGSCLDNIPIPPNGPFATDDTTVLRLAPAHSFAFGSNIFEWTAIPDGQWPSEANMVIIGDEVILFKEVEIDDNGWVSISTLIRGWRGTELKAYDHGAKRNERFVVVTEQGIRNIQEELNNINKTFSFRTQSPGLLINLPTVLQKTLTGASLKPYAPAYFNRVEDTPSGGDTRVTWARRTRYGGGWNNGTGTVPLNEETESYDAYLLAAPFDEDTFDQDDDATYVRAFIGLTTPQLDYTAAMMVTDGVVQEDDINVVVFQNSGRVGHGYPGYDTLTFSILDDF